MGSTTKVSNTESLKTTRLETIGSITPAQTRTPAPGDPATVRQLLADAYALAATSEYLNQSSCVNALLDCLNAATRPSIRSTISEALSEISRVRLVRARTFRVSLDSIQLALKIDQVLDLPGVLNTEGLAS